MGLVRRGYLSISEAYEKIVATLEHGRPTIICFPLTKTNETLLSTRRMTPRKGGRSCSPALLRPDS
jgi:hypothetical protein